MRRCTVSCLAALLLVLASSPAYAIEVAGSWKLGYRIGPGGELSALATD